MALTLPQLKGEIRRLLDQSGNSSLGTVTDGAGNVLADNDTVFTDALNMGGAELARSCYVRHGTGTFAVTTAGQRSFPLHLFTMPAGTGRLWAAQEVAWGVAGGTLALLQEWEMSKILNRRPGYMFKAAGEPNAWFESGTQAVIAIDPAPSLTTKTLSCFGLVLPPLLGDGTNGTVTQYDYFPDDEGLRLVPAAAAIYIAKKNYDNVEVYGRLGHLIPDYDERRMNWYNQIEKATRDKYYPTPPVLFAPAKK